MSRNFSLDEGEFYHLYNRGTEKRNIFLTNRDKERFLMLLYLCNSNNPVRFDNISSGKEYEVERGEILVNIGAYCLMPNHYHILVQEKQEGGISKFSQKLSTAYTMYFNKKNERKGTLFESKYKIKHLDEDKYLEYIFSYIHLNPIKLIESGWKERGIKNHGKAKTFLSNYKWSSYVDYIKSSKVEPCSSRVEGIILNRQAFPDYFGEEKSFEGVVDSWLDYRHQDDD